MRLLRATERRQPRPRFTADAFVSRLADGGRLLGRDCPERATASGDVARCRAQARFSRQREYRTVAMMALLGAATAMPPARAAASAAHDGAEIITISAEIFLGATLLELMRALLFGLGNCSAAISAARRDAASTSVDAAASFIGLASPATRCRAAPKPTRARAPRIDALRLSVDRPNAIC